MEAAARNPRIRFGAFEVDLRSGELHKHGIRIKLQDQPFQVLVLLLEHSGELVTREELQRKLWPADTFVDFDTSLNSAIKKLRDALADSAEEPRSIETVPRRGYRFIAQVENAPKPTLAVMEKPLAPVLPPASSPGFWNKRRAFVAAGAAILLIVGTFASWRIFFAKPVLTGTDVILLASFVNKTGDPIFDNSLDKALQIKLTESPFLSVLPEGSVRETLRTMRGVKSPSHASKWRRIPRSRSSPRWAKRARSCASNWAKAWVLSSSMMRRSIWPRPAHSRLCKPTAPVWRRCEPEIPRKPFLYLNEPSSSIPGSVPPTSCSAAPITALATTKRRERILRGPSSSRMAVSPRKKIFWLPPRITGTLLAIWKRKMPFWFCTSKPTRAASRPPTCWESIIRCWAGTKNRCNNSAGRWNTPRCPPLFTTPTPARRTCPWTGWTTPKNYWMNGGRRDHSFLIKSICATASLFSKTTPPPWNGWPAKLRPTTLACCNCKCGSPSCAATSKNFAPRVNR